MSSPSNSVRRSKRRSASAEDVLKDKTPHQLRAMLKVDDEPEFSTHAGLRLWTAALWLPRFVLITQVASTVALVASVLAMGALWARDPAVLLMSSPTGLTRCAPAPIDPATAKPLERPSAHQQLCAQLEREFIGQQTAAAAKPAAQGK